MVESPSSEADSCSDSQIPRILWKAKVYNCVHKSPPLDHILRQMNPIHTLVYISLRSILIACYHELPGLVSSLFPSACPTKIP